MILTRKSHALSFAAAAGLGTTGIVGLAATPALVANPQSAAANPSSRCENGTLIGTYALRSIANGKFVRPRNGTLKAVENQAPTQNNEATIFQMYDISKLPGGSAGMFAVRSAQSPDRWWRVRDNNTTVKLDDGNCEADKTSYQFSSSRQDNNFAIKSKGQNKWIRVDSDDNKLKASSDNPNGNNKHFAFMRIGQPANEQSRSGGRNNIHGWWTTQGRGTWWRGKQTGNNITLTKFVNGNHGKPVMQFEGRLDSEGNSVGTLRQCGQQSGSNYSIQRRTNNIYYFGGNSRTLSRSRNAPPFRTNTSEACARENTNINGWWRDRQGRFWRAEQNNNQVKITRYRESDGKPYSIFTGATRNRRNTDLYSYGTLKNCFSVRNRPRSFSLINGQLRSDGGPTVLTRNRSRIPFTPQTGCDPATAETAARKQLLTLQKTVTLTDKEISVYYETGTKIFNTSITVNRPSRRETAISEFTDYLDSECENDGHGFYVDEVTYGAWDQVRVDSQGVASFYNNVALHESDGDLGTGGCPNLAWTIGRHYTIPDGDNATTSVYDTDVSPSRYNSKLKPGPFLTVRPGETMTRTLDINKSDGRIEITYRLTNHTQRVRPRDN